MIHNFDQKVNLSFNYRVMCRQKGVTQFTNTLEMFILLRHRICDDATKRTNLLGELRLETIY